MHCSSLLFQDFRTPQTRSSLGRRRGVGVKSTGVRCGLSGEWSAGGVVCTGLWGVLDGENATTHEGRRPLHGVISRRLELLRFRAAYALRKQMPSQRPAPYG